MRIKVTWENFQINGKISRSFYLTLKMDMCKTCNNKDKLGQIIAIYGR